MNPNTIPHTLRSRPQWVVWRPEERDGKFTKVPYIPGTLHRARSNAPGTWSTFEYALACCQQRRLGGLGFVLTAGDGLVGIDLDHCAPNGVLESWARTIVETLGSYSEWSPSGSGVHIFVRGQLPPNGRRRGQVEMYDRSRFFTVTGRRLDLAPPGIERCQAELSALHARVFAPVETPAPRQVVVTPTPDDAALIRRAAAARNGAKFLALWRGDSSGYLSQSEADLALCNYLVFWTGGNPDRVDRLFRQSGLFRSKWDVVHFADGRTYGQATIQKSLG